MKRKRDELTDSEHMETLDMLYTAAGSMQGRDAMKTFLKELLTPSEKIMLGRRIWIARLLLQGYTPSEVGEKLQVGPNTVWRVEKWLNAQMPGYKQAIRNLEQEMSDREKKRAISKNPFGLTALKKKYPLHFLLFPAPKAKNKK